MQYDEQKLLGYFRNLRYPAGKDEIMRWSKDNGAPQDILDKLDSSPDVTYRGYSDIMTVLGVEGYAPIEYEQQGNTRRDFGEAPSPTPTSGGQGEFTGMDEKRNVA